MSSPANVTIKNRTNQSITTKVTRDSWVEGDGSSIDGKVIPRGEHGVFKVVAKTGHHGELDIDFIGGDSGNVLGTLEILSIKDPQEGVKSLAVNANQSEIDVSAMGYRSSPNDNELRRVNFLIV
ncbi:hypothetical protein [Pseudoalteromonas piscicida]|uniref:hypothetical protein n=1 Tax=Pseudoalteromonas piscicida TaxID=43662 RepID=UPI0027E4337C|nr:hypothetical protein [Pseudoalteromonas piscicida]WMO13145.1 hypothetical protein NI376_13875 [Pseudoalteromonas piscicida]